MHKVSCFEEFPHHLTMPKRLDAYDVYKLLLEVERFTTPLIT